MKFGWFSTAGICADRGWFESTCCSKTRGLRRTTCRSSTYVGMGESAENPILLLILQSFDPPVSYFYNFLPHNHFFAEQRLVCWWVSAFPLLGKGRRITGLEEHLQHRSWHSRWVVVSLPKSCDNS